MMLKDIILIIFSLITVGGALFVLFTQKILDAAYGLLVSLLGVAALFVFSNAEFVAASQIVIYVGGVLVILIFGIVLSRDSKNKAKTETKENILKGGLIFGILLILIFALMSQLKFETNQISKASDVRDIGLQMLGANVFNLELIGILLLMALVATTYILKDDK
jgi:NADH-quinone oxidoreductase subunit J